MKINPLVLILAVLSLCTISACEDEVVWECVIEEEVPDFSSQIGCYEDYTKLSSDPVTANIPGALSVKTVIDQRDENALYFQNSEIYKIHYDFASQNLSGNGLDIVPMLSEFNAEMYYSPQRRFLLGALTYYEGPDIWAYEISPYDTASAEMIEAAFRLIKENSYIGNVLYFHPTSDAVTTVAQDLPSFIPIITTEEIYAGIDYQPLNLGTSMGQLRFIEADQLETQYLSFRDIVVLDAVPNDISVCLGIITQEFQTPLSHINVLSQNRGTPNMGLREAYTNEDLRALEGDWVELVVGANDYSITQVTQQEADEWWDLNKPDQVQVPEMDLSVQELVDAEDILQMETMDDLGDALNAAIPAFGGKTSHYSGFPHMEPMGFGSFNFPKAFGVPVYFYATFMEENGFDIRVEEMLVDSGFQNDPATRAAMLEELRDDMIAAPVNSDFESLLMDKLETEFPGTRMRFRSSTNAEDLDGFTGAGLYTSQSGDPGDPEYPVMDAVKTVWSSLWFFRAFEEREYRSIDHLAVGMALLVHHSFPFEEANGVAVTANIFDSSGVEPGYYVNAQIGDISVVQPDPGVTSDQFILHWTFPGQPIVYIAHSNLITGDSVLTRAQTLELGAALTVIHNFYNSLYGPWTPDHFYAMDVEFKFDDDGWGPGSSELHIKQARPYPGWAANSSGS